MTTRQAVGLGATIAAAMCLWVALNPTHSCTADAMRASQTRARFCAMLYDAHEHAHDPLPSQ